MRLATIGFTKNAETFFETLRAARIRCVVDVRLDNVSQLAGFAKKQNLAYFWRKSAELPMFIFRFWRLPSRYWTHTRKRAGAGQSTNKTSWP